MVQDLLVVMEESYTDKENVTQDWPVFKFPSNTFNFRFEIFEVKYTVRVQLEFMYTDTVKPHVVTILVLRPPHYYDHQVLDRFCT